jgi:ring-1,2-phenylacetyl-CoA epoxidase subunit PaaD
MEEIARIKQTEQAIRNLLETVKDPEIPVLSILDLGVVREILPEGNAVTVVITPTYSGCPAMDMIEVEIRKTLRSAGYERVTVKTVLAPAWTTDWLTEAGKEKLLAYGIAPPVATTTDKRVLMTEFSSVPCPHCGSKNTALISQFGSTACKSLFRCKDCLEPFDYFKCH